MYPPSIAMDVNNMDYKYMKIIKYDDRILKCEISQKRAEKGDHIHETWNFIKMLLSEDACFSLANVKMGRRLVSRSFTH